MNYINLKIILAELLAWYSQAELCEKMNLSKQTISTIIRGDVSEMTEFKVRQFWEAHVRKNIAPILMADFVDAAKDKKTLIVDTPDGAHLVPQVFEKKPRSTVIVKTLNHNVSCSIDHLIETDFGWVLAKDLQTGVNVLTIDGLEPVLEIKELQSAPVFDFEVSHENHRYWAGTGISSHNSGKSFIASNITKQAQLDGYHILFLDSEHAIDVDYLSKIGVSTSPDNLTYISVTTIEDVNSILSDFFKGYKKEYGTDNMDAPKVLIVLDSLAMLSSSTEIENYEKSGVIKGDQGQLAKRRKAMLRLTVGAIGRLPIAMVLTDHVYPQDIMLGDGPWTITNSTKFSSSIIGIVTKLKLKEENEVVGVRMRFETYKSRFAKLGTKVELEVPYNKGMSAFTGLVELLEEMGVIAKGTQPGEKLSYVCTISDEDGVLKDRIVFKEKDLTDDIAIRLLQHPLCKPMLEVQAPEIDIAEIPDDEVQGEVDD